MLAMCGVSWMRGWRQNACSGGSGSGSVTSSTASPICPLAMAASRSASTSCGPRPDVHQRRRRRQPARTARHRESRGWNRSAAAGTRGCRCAPERPGRPVGAGMALHASTAWAERLQPAQSKPKPTSLRQHRLAQRAQAQHADAALAPRRAPAAAATGRPAAGARYCGMSRCRSSTAWRHVLDHAVARCRARPCAPAAAWAAGPTKSNWSTPAPEENSTCRFGKLLARSGGGCHAARKRTCAGSPMSGQMRKSITGSRRGTPRPIAGHAPGPTCRGRCWRSSCQPMAWVAMANSYGPPGSAASAGPRTMVVGASTRSRPMPLQPFGQAAGEVDVDAHEVARRSGPTGGRSRPSRLRHRAPPPGRSTWPRPKRRSIAKPRARFPGPAPRRLRRGQQVVRSARRAACRGPRRRAPSAVQPRSAGRAQAPAGRQRHQRRGRAAPWCWRTSPVRTKPRRSYRPRPSGVACSSTVRPSRPVEQRAHQPVAERRPWQAGDTITRPIVAWRSPQRQRSAVPTSRRRARPPCRRHARRPAPSRRGGGASAVRRTMHAPRQVGGGHGAQHHAVEGGGLRGLGRSESSCEQKGSAILGKRRCVRQYDSRSGATRKLRLRRCPLSQFAAAARPATHTNAAPLCLASVAMQKLRRGTEPA